MSLYKNRHWLTRKYETGKYSTRDIGEMCGVSFQTIRYWLNKLGIPRRYGRDGNRTSRAIEKCRTASSLRKHTPEGVVKIRNSKMGENNPNWGGGIARCHGYVYQKESSHPHATTRGYVLRSRLMVEKSLGYYLDPENVVHHINEVTDDDRRENLIPFTTVAEHVRHHRSSGQCSTCGVWNDKLKPCPGCGEEPR